MYSLYISIAAGLLPILILGAFNISVAWTILPALLITGLCFTFMNRRFGKLVEGLVHQANLELQVAQNMMQRGGGTGGKAVQLTIEKKTEYAITLLKKGFRFQKWQLGSALSLNAQIGMILFSQSVSQNIFSQGGQKKSKSSKGGKGNKGHKEQLSEAMPYLEGAFVTGMKAKLMQGLWHAWLRLAVCYFVAKKDIDKTVEVMEQIVKVANKEGFAWSVYAWFYCKTNQIDKAIDVLARAVQASDDPNLPEQLSALQNGKKTKMSVYGDYWWGLGLEPPKHLNPKTLQKTGHPRMKSKRGMRR